LREALEQAVLYHVDAICEGILIRRLP
jgi:hypothetical protein